ncbi:hypothetical protein K438DRAFT_1861737 [Mycena galopus ATCC 62051]|nr:hypothetical protein K438DRAFT_1861737 [Mycena galopus ATCC 62051]
MLWHPQVRMTRSGRVFGPRFPEIAILGTCTFDFAPHLSQAVAVEADGQEDYGHEDASVDGIDEVWPPNPDPLNEVDEEWPMADPLNEVDDIPTPQVPASRKRCRSTTYDDCISTGKALSGPHRRRAAKRLPRKRLTAMVPHVKPVEPTHVLSFDASTLPAAHGAYSGKGSKTRRSLTDLLGLGLQLVPWDGVNPIPLVDKEGRIFAVLAGQPTAHGYADSVRRAFEFMKFEGNKIHFPPSMLHHRRGLFAAINVGLTYGKGQSVPTWLDTKDYTPLVEKLLAHKDIKRMAAFASCAFSFLRKRLGYYDQCNKDLKKAFPHLCRPFAKSVFSCAAFNFGPRVCTFKHRDVCNLPFGWCAIQSMGYFDAKKGGHLVLWDANLVMEFPAGALILLPSATIAHSNVPVQDHEERVSFTQFTAGGLFRFIDNGFQTQDELAAADPAEHARLMALKETRWEEGLRLFSTAEEMFNAK